MVLFLYSILNSCDPESFKNTRFILSAVYHHPPPCCAAPCALYPLWLRSPAPYLPSAAKHTCCDPILSLWGFISCYVGVCMCLCVLCIFLDTASGLCFCAKLAAIRSEDYLTWLRSDLWAAAAQSLLWFNLICFAKQVGLATLWNLEYHSV